MPPNSAVRTRNRSSSGAFTYAQQDNTRNNRNNQHHTPLVNHASTVHNPATVSTPPLRPSSVADLGMTAATRYAHNLKVLRRRDPSILRIFDQFSHVCVYHHNGERWEKKGFEGSMFLYERADYPPYGFYILNRMGMDDYIQRLWPEDNVGVHGNYLMLRTWPEWSRKRVVDIEATIRGGDRDPFDMLYKWNGQNPPSEDKATSQTIGLWMFATDLREPMIDVMIRLHGFIKQNMPYPEEFRYGPDKPPPPNPHASSVNGALNRAPSAASTGSGVSAASSSHTGSISTSSSQPRSQRHSPNAGYVNPLLYQATDSSSMTSANHKSLDGTPRAKTKPKKRKPKGGALAESGGATPMANSANQMSDLDVLFAKLSNPLDIKASSVSLGRGPSLMETLMGSDNSTPSVSSNIVPATFTRQPLSATNKVTLESLFASVTNPAAPSNNNEIRADPTSKRPKRLEESSFSSTQVDSSGRVETTSTNSAGLSLLNDIFASASSFSLDKLPETDNGSGLVANDGPETIEIHSPRPHAPLRLASMLDAAAAGPSPSPNAVSGLGLEHFEPSTRRQRPIMLTEQVMETLLRNGGSMDLDYLEDSPGVAPTSNGQVCPDATSEITSQRDPADMNDQEPEEVRRRLLDMIGLGSQDQPQFHSYSEASGDLTPRVAASNIPLEQNSLHLDTESLISSSHKLSLTSYEDNSLTDEDEDEAILELDFSDTRALSDIRVFENRERALREQRKMASRSATPAVQAGTGATTKTPFYTSVVSEQKYVPVATPPPPPAIQPVSFTEAKPTKLEKIPDAPVRPGTPIQTSQQKVTVSISTPATPSAQTPITEAPAGTPSSSKKKTRRGRGKARDKDRGESKDGSPTPDAPSRGASHIAVENNINGAIIEDIFTTPGDDSAFLSDVVVKRAFKINSKVCQSSTSNDSPVEVSTEISESPSLPMKECLSVALSRRKSQVKSKEDLVEFALTLLQNDSTFVADLWQTWQIRGAMQEANLSNAAMLASPATDSSICSSSPTIHTVTNDINKLPEVHETSLNLITNTHSAPALVSTLPDVSQSRTDAKIEDKTDVVDSENTHVGLTIPPIVKDVVSTEVERCNVDASAETGREGQSKETQDYGVDEESNVIESL